MRKKIICTQTGTITVVSINNILSHGGKKVSESIKSDRGRKGTIYTNMMENDGLNKKIKQGGRTQTTSTQIYNQRLIINTYNFISSSFFALFFLFNFFSLFQNQNENNFLDLITLHTLIHTLKIKPLF